MFKIEGSYFLLFFVYCIRVTIICFCTILQFWISAVYNRKLFLLVYLTFDIQRYSRIVDFNKILKSLGGQESNIFNIINTFFYQKHLGT